MTFRYGIFFIILLLSCTNSRNKKETELINNMNDISYQSGVNDSVINNILQQIPSPIEMSSLVRESGAQYNKNMLNDPEAYSKYNNSFERALNLGIYGADLGYSNLYEENQQCILYVGAIKDLADELRIDQFFNFKMIERLADQRNLDSLLLISTQSYNQVNSYFQEQQRPGLSVLLLVGGWLEAMHITAQTAMHATHNKALMEKIGEQKIVIKSIVHLMDYFKNTDENFSKLYQELINLDKSFDSVTIETQYAPPTTVEEDGVVMTKDNSKSTINIDIETFNAIRDKVSAIRSEITS